MAIEKAAKVVSSLGVTGALTVDALPESLRALCYPVFYGRLERERRLAEMQAITGKSKQEVVAIIDKYVPMYGYGKVRERALAGRLNDLLP